jgi:hypothetical protein
MASINIASTREKYPGKNDQDIAKALAEKSDYIGVVRYKNSPASRDFTNFGLCRTEAEIRGYLTSPYCNDVELIYDGRAALFPLDAEHVLKGSCKTCGRLASAASLQLGAGNDFYFCPKCGLLFCDTCYPRLPLTASPGYGTCIVCRVQVKRALPSFFVGRPKAPSAPSAEKLRNGGADADSSAGPEVGPPGFWRRILGKGFRRGPSRSGSKAELISMILELTKIDKGGYIETLESAAETIAKSGKFRIEIVKELVLDEFFTRRAECSVGTVPMRLGAKMGGAQFAQWLAENVVVGRQPAQMIDYPAQYGAFGMWQDAKSLCEKYGIRFEERPA